MDEKFQKAEQEYFILRGKLQTGHITREEFEAALKEQMAQDAQCRYWILGINSGKWYVHDGKDWVQSEPPNASDAPIVAPTPPIAPPAPTRKSNRLPIIAALGCLAIICLTVAGVGACIFFKPGAPRSTLAAFAPTSGVIILTPTFSAITTSTRESIADAVPTAPPTPAFPPGFYITAIRTNPPKPIRRQDVLFDVRFLNTTGGGRSYRWLVYVYKPDQKNSLGETPSSPFTFPPGTGEAEIGTWRLTGAGGCEDFIARVAWLDDNKRPTLFTKPDGQVFEQPFQVCP